MCTQDLQNFRATIKNKILIFVLQVFSVEFQRLNQRMETKTSLLNFMRQNGYRNRSNVTSTTRKVNDFIFVKEGYLEEIYLFNVHNGVVIE